MIAAFVLMLGVFQMQGCGTCVQFSFSAPSSTTGWNMAVDTNGWDVEEVWFMNETPFLLTAWHMEGDLLLMSGFTCPNIDPGEWFVVQVEFSGSGGWLSFVSDGPGGTGTRWLQDCWVAMPSVMLNDYHPRLVRQGDCQCTNPNT